jgi:hypothetical protein
MSATHPADENLITIRRMLAESDKFVAEQRKLSAEASKMDRERHLAPWQLVVTSMGAGAALFAAGAAFLKLLGH